MAKNLKIKLEHAILKHPQTLGVVERSHSALKRILKLNTQEQRNDWFKYVQLAVFIHNTSYHFAIGCSPTVLFHGREPLKHLDPRFNTTSLEQIQSNSEYVIALQDAMLKNFTETKEKLTVMYNKYRAYYDSKAEAQPLNQYSFCLLLNLKLTTQSEFSGKLLPIWLTLYRVDQVLTNSNYRIRKVGTPFTQCVVPQYQTEDLVDVNPDNFRRDPMLSRFRSEPALFVEAVPTLLIPSEDLQAVPTQSEPITAVRVTLSFPIAPAAILPAAPAAGPAIPTLPGMTVTPACPQSPNLADITPAPSERRVTGESIPGEISTRSSDASASHTATSPATDTILLGSRSTRNKTDPNAATLRNTERPLRLHREAKTTTLDSHPDCYRNTGGRATLPKTWMRAFASGDLTSATHDKRNLLPQSCQKTRPQSSSGQPNFSGIPRATQNVRDSSLQTTGSKQGQTSPYNTCNTRTSKSRPPASSDMQTIASASRPNFCFPNASILTTSSSFAHCVSADFAMARGLAFEVGCRYLAIKSFRNQKFSSLPPGSLATFFDPISKRYTYNLITILRYFHKPTYDALQLSLYALRTHLERHKIRELSIPLLECGLDQLHWPTVFSILFQVFAQTTISITIHQAVRR